jgi:hypothetical protein
MKVEDSVAWYSVPGHVGCFKWQRARGRNAPAGEPRPGE